MDEHGHRGTQMIDAVEVAFGEGAEVPEARVDLPDALAHVSFVGMLGARVVEARAAEAEQVLVVGAGAAADRGSRGKRLLQHSESVEHPARHFAVADSAAQVAQRLRLDFESGSKLGIREHGFSIGVEAVELHELVIEVKGNGEAVRYGAGRQAEPAQRGEVRRLYAERCPVVEADLVERGDRPDGQIALRRLRLGGANGCVMRLDLGG